MFLRSVGKKVMKDHSLGGEISSSLMRREQPPLRRYCPSFIILLLRDYTVI